MNEASMLQLRSIAVRDVFDMSASNNLMAPSVAMSVSVFNEMNKSYKSVTAESEFCETCV
jgi:hypothetical protein